MSFQYTVQKSFSVAMGHILEDAYTKKCCNLHGHTYTVVVELGGDKLNSDGMLADYTHIKEVFKRIVENKFDHATIIPPKWHERFKDIPGVINIQFNPTAENIAQFFFNLLEDELSNEYCTLTKVIVKETETNYACYSPY